ncbi:MAG TPA: RNA polymerase sigma factor SigW, partial [Elusimicrobia bacterium]|nr:RNA polymerase sigma factor SigW [Elusimicrobiota bacterium]
LADNLPAPADASEELLEQQRQLALVKEALAGMPEKYRTVIDLYYFKERSYQEIADALAIPINTVKIRLLRAKERLRERSGGPE